VRGGPDEKTALLKNYILDPEILVMPGAHDALSARIIEKIGFKALAVGGYPATAALMGGPDISFLTLPEMVDHLTRLTDIRELVTAGGLVEYGRRLLGKAGGIREGPG
jgi:methylisocitrate lyase